MNKPILLDTITCSDALAYLNTIPDETIDMILTSPPYDNLRTYKGYTWDFEGIARDSYRVLKTGGVLVWVVGDATVEGSETLSSFKQALYFVGGAGFKLHDTMIYYKNGAVMNNHHPRYIDSFEYMFVLSKGVPTTFNGQLRKTITEGALTGSGKRQRNGQLQTFGNVRTPTAAYSLDVNVWRVYSGGGHNDKYASEHPASFPEKLAERHIMTWTNAGDTVLDFFAGSGTTLKMARNLNRRYLGCDISEEYVALARKRLAQPFTVSMFAD